MIVAEHRLERIVQFADVVVHVPGRGEPVRVGPPREVLVGDAPAPPVVRLGASMGWDPVPLTVREARRQAGPLRRRLEGHQAPGLPAPTAAPDSRPVVARVHGLRARTDRCRRCPGWTWTCGPGRCAP